MIKMVLSELVPSPIKAWYIARLILPLYWKVTVNAIDVFETIQVSKNICGNSLINERGM
jgi:hypothetical protein